jgi:type IV secretion system protein VirB4
MRKARQEKAGDRLPYSRIVDERTVVLRDGSLMQCLHLEGFAFETAETVDLNHRQAMRDAALKAVAGSRFVVHHHILRRKVAVDLTADFADPICAAIDRRWRDRLGSRRLFVNNLFISILRRPPKGKAGWADRIGGLFSRGLGATERVAALTREIRELDAAREALQAGLAAYAPALLGGYDTPNGRCSEPLELLSALYNGELKPVLAPDGDAGHHIPYKRTSFGAEALEQKGAGADKSFAAILSLKEYPPHAQPGMIDALLRLPYEMALSESFAFVDRQIGVERVDLALRRFRAADDDAQSLRRGLVEAKDDLASGRSAIGEHSFSLLLRAPSLVELDRAAADCASALADIGAVPVRETLNLEPAYWAQFPGNDHYAARRSLISTGAFASFASLHGFPIGQANGNHWGQAVTVFETTSATPYFFNFHRGDLGNFTVIGPSGSGKTVVLNFLAAQAGRFAPRTVFFDKDRGAEIFLRGIGGHYATLRPGAATGFNPLQNEGTAEDRAFLRALVARLVCKPGERPSPEEEATIAAAVVANYEQEPGYRRLRYFVELLAGGRRPQQGDLASRLAPWIGKGEHAWLFDNPVDRLDVSTRTLGFDMTALLEDPVLRTPAMMYLFHRVEQRLDGEPTVILIDEGWKALDDEVFAARIRDWMKTLRKRNAILGFGTQSARDALESRIASAIIEQAATQIFMPNPRAQKEDYCTGFGLTEHELELVRALPPQAHGFLVKHGNHSVVARLDLGDMPDILIALSGRESSVRRLDELRQRFGDHPSQWWPHLIGTPWPGPPEADPEPFPKLRVAAP